MFRETSTENSVNSPNFIPTPYRCRDRGRNQVILRDITPYVVRRSIFRSC